jgi:cytochrome c-type biogenesis protein
MNELFLGGGAALWLGILTSISPCPLTTNIAAISYVGGRVGKTRRVLFSGLLYTLGRALAYVAVVLFVTRSLNMVPGVSHFLQKYMNLAVGPLLLVAGLLLLDVFRFSIGGGISGNFQKRVDRMGVWGALVLGIVFALAFCPVSAGLFFGGLLPLALKGNAVLLSGLYGIGTALPVIGFALLLAFAAHAVGTIFNKLTIIEMWARRITAAVMVLVGVVLILKYNFGLYFGI